MKLRRLRRRATSLLEMLTIIVLVSMVVTLLGGAWQSLGRVQRRLEQALEESRQVQRLAERFRADVRDARDVAVAAAPGAAEHGGCTLTHRDGRAIEYRSRAGGLERLVRRGETLEHRDLFRLSPEVRSELMLSQAGPTPQVELRLSRVESIVASHAGKPAAAATTAEDQPEASDTANTAANSNATHAPPASRPWVTIVATVAREESAP